MSDPRNCWDVLSAVPIFILLAAAHGLFNQRSREPRNVMTTTEWRQRMDKLPKAIERTTYYDDHK